MDFAGGYRDEWTEVQTAFCRNLIKEPCYYIRVPYFRKLPYGWYTRQVLGPEWVGRLVLLDFEYLL